MAKITIKNRYGVAPNELLCDPEISFKAKGLYAYIQSKPDDWDFSGDRIAKNETSDGRAAVYAGLDELETANYLHRIKYKNERGQWESDYILYDTPTKKPTAENQQREESGTTADFPQSDFPQSDNQQIIKEGDTKQEIQSNSIFTVVEKREPEKRKYPLLSEKLIEFSEHRKEMRKPMKATSQKAFLRKLQKLSGGNEEIAVQILENSIANSWQGIFAIE